MDHSIEVKFKDGSTGRYTFLKDLQPWEDYFVKIWKKAGHKVTTVQLNKGKK